MEHSVVVVQFLWRSLGDVLLAANHPLHLALATVAFDGDHVAGLLVGDVRWEVPRLLLSRRLLPVPQYRPAT